VRRRWVRIVVGIFALLVILAGGLLLAFRLTSPPASAPLQASARRELPREWTVPKEPSQPPVSTQTPSTSTADAIDRPEVFSTTGTLVFYGDGRPFGQEIYEIRIADRGATVVSTGEFRFKALVATIRIAFEQRLEADENLSARRYEAVFDAPLGMNRRLRADISDGVARIASNDDETEVPVNRETIVLGTFATYALLPTLFALRDRDGLATFNVLSLGGNPHQEGTDGEDLPRMTMERTSPVRIRVDGVTLQVDAYAIRSSLGESLLLAREREFLALIASSEEGSLAVYRADFFPDGFELASEDDLAIGLPLTKVP